MAKKLFIGRIADSVTTQHLEELFSQVGEIDTITIVTDRMTGTSRGFGFVEMKTDEDAKKAIEKFNGYVLEGKSIVVNEAKPPEDRNRSFGGGGGGGGRNRQDRRSW